MKRIHNLSNICFQMRYQNDIGNTLQFHQQSTYLFNYVMLQKTLCLYFVFIIKLKDTARYHFKRESFFLIWSKNPTAARKRGRKKCTRCINRLSITAINSLSLFPSKELINNYHHHFFLHSTYIQICRRKSFLVLYKKKSSK